MAETSSFADVWTIHSLCSGWKICASEIFSGPFVGNTSFPIMLIGNTADPAAPLQAAKNMSKGFKDAVVLTQDSPGHTSLAAASACTFKFVRAYFREGELPPANTVCEDDSPIFPSNGTGSQNPPASSPEKRELLEAARDLSRRLRVPRLGIVF